METQKEIEQLKQTLQGLMSKSEAALENLELKSWLSRLELEHTRIQKDIEKVSAVLDKLRVLVAQAQV